jgi:hypothetical protein
MTSNLIKPGLQRFGGQLCGQYRPGRVAATRGVGHCRHPEATEQIEHAGATSHVDRGKAIVVSSAPDAILAVAADLIRRRGQRLQLSLRASTIRGTCFNPILSVRGRSV